MTISQTIVFCEIKYDFQVTLSIRQSFGNSWATLTVMQ